MSPKKGVRAAKQEQENRKAERLAVRELAPGERLTMYATILLERLAKAQPAGEERTAMVAAVREGRDRPLSADEVELFQRVAGRDG